MHRAALQSIYRTGDRQIGFAGASRTNAKCDVVLRDVVQVDALGRRAGTHIVAPRGQAQAAIALCGHVFVTGQHQLHLFFGNRFGRTLIHGLQHFQGAFSLGFVAIDFEFFVAVRDLDLQGQFDGAQVFIQGTTQVAQTRVVGGGEAVAQDQAVGPYCISPLPKDQFSLATSTRLMNTSCWRIWSSLDTSSAMRR